MRERIFAGLDMHWGSQFELLELVTQVRCIDPWFQEVLKEFRDGRLSEENYNFLHGHPTQHTGTWYRDTEGASCDNVRCDETSAESSQNDWYSVRVAAQFWEDMRNLECQLCAVERRWKCRVAHSPEDPRFHVAPFGSALYVHPNNEPKCQAVLDRARRFALVAGRIVSCVLVLDKSDELSRLESDQRREKTVRFVFAKARHGHQGHPRSSAIRGGTPHALD